MTFCGVVFVVSDAVAAGTNDVVSDADCCSCGTYYDLLWCRICSLFLALRVH